MFDREKQLVIDRYCRAIFHETDKISVLALINLNIPKPIKHFIECEIKKYVQKEFDEFKKYSKFELNHPKVKPLVEELKILLMYNHELTQNQLTILLKFALDLNLDYLLKPFDTLTTFVFKYEDFQSVQNIKERMNYISEYEYLPLLINEYFNRTGISRITKNDFLNLLIKIDKEFTRDYTIIDHYNLFSRFRTFLSELNLFIKDVPEYEAFIIFLKDKNHNTLASFLEENRDNFKTFGGNISAYLRSMIPEKRDKIFAKGLNVKSQEFIEEVSKKESEVFDEQDSKNIKGEDFSATSNGESPETILPKEVEEVNPQDKQGEKIEEVESKKKINELQKRLITPIQQKPKKEYDRNLDGLMPKRLRKKVIKKVFNDNEFSFVEFMTSMNRVQNWDEASLLLTELFDKNNIQPFSKWAIKFTEFLYENIK